MKRGVEKRDIFLKPQDYSRFTVALEFFNRPSLINLWQLVARTTRKTAVAGTVPATHMRERLENERKKPCERLVDILAYTLMPNHFHLILKEITEGGISLFMRKLGGYAGYFNKQYKRVGPLFQSRYKAVRVTTDEQLAAVFHYVHINPIEIFYPHWQESFLPDRIKDSGKFLQALQEYQWSSFHDYFGISQSPSLIQKDFFLDFFGGQEACKKAFQERIMTKIQQPSGLEHFD